LAAALSSVSNFKINSQIQQKIPTLARTSNYQIWSCLLHHTLTVIGIWPIVAGTSLYANIGNDDDWAKWILLDHRSVAVISLYLLQELQHHSTYDYPPVVQPPALQPQLSMHILLALTLWDLLAQLYGTTCVTGQFYLFKEALEMPIHQ
jgi:hypothetical protein